MACAICVCLFVPEAFFSLHNRWRITKTWAKFSDPRVKWSVGHMLACAEYRTVTGVATYHKFTECICSNLLWSAGCGWCAFLWKWVLKQSGKNNALAPCQWGNPGKFLVYWLISWAPRLPQDYLLFVFLWSSHAIMHSAGSLHPIPTNSEILTLSPVSRIQTHPALLRAEASSQVAPSAVAARHQSPALQAGWCRHLDRLRNLRGHDGHAFSPFVSGAGVHTLS